MTQYQWEAQHRKTIGNHLTGNGRKTLPQFEIKLQHKCNFAMCRWHSNNIQQ
jgi:hypothetical protein